MVVLSVEDDPAIAFILPVAFQECGFPVKLYQAGDGEEALALLQPSNDQTRIPRPDLILLDVNMPNKNGVEVLAALQGDAELSSIPVIIFTSASRASERMQCLALGAVEYLIKPPDYDGLVKAIQSVCARMAAA